MNVLSLFDGMSCGQIAFDRLNITFDGIQNKYFASEIKKHAIELTKHHYPNTIHIGDVTKVSYRDGILYTENGNYNVIIDTLIGGSPCQDFSIIKVNGKGLKGEKSRLFYEYLRLLDEIKPKYFLLENVIMKNDSEQQLNNYLGVEGVHINSNLVSYQNRPRIYWTNIPGVTIPKDKNIRFQDFKDTDYDYCKEFKVNRTPSRERMWNDGNGKNSIGSCANITNSNKIYCITRKQDRAPNSGLIEFDDFCRFLTRREIEIGQTLPVGYTNMLSYNQMQDVCGDGWTIDVIVHLLKGIKENKEPTICRLQQMSIDDFLKVI